VNRCLVCGREVDPANGEELRFGCCSDACLERFNAENRDMSLSPRLRRLRRRRCRMCRDLCSPLDLREGLCPTCVVIGPPRPPTHNYGLYVGAPASPISELSMDRPTPVEGVWLDPSEEFIRAQHEVAQRLEPSTELQALIGRWAEDQRRRHQDELVGTPAHRGAGWFDAPDFDLWACLEYNSQRGWGHTDIERVCAQIRAAEQGDNWHWVLRLLDGRYVYLAAWCHPLRAGWHLESTAQAWTDRDSPYACLMAGAPPDHVYRELVRQIVEDMLRNVRQRIAADQAAHPSHKVYQAMGFETNHCWLCENCGFASVDERAARKHSEMPESAPGTRRIRRQRSSAAQPTTTPPRRLRGPRHQI